MTTPVIESRASQQLSDHWAYKILNKLKDIMYIPTRNEDNIY